MAFNRFLHYNFSRRIGRGTTLCSITQTGEPTLRSLDPRTVLHQLQWRKCYVMPLQSDVSFGVTSQAFCSSSWRQTVKEQGGRWVLLRHCDWQRYHPTEYDMFKWYDNFIRYHFTGQRTGVRCGDTHWYHIDNALEQYARHCLDWIHWWAEI